MSRKMKSYKYIYIYFMFKFKPSYASIASLHESASINIDSVVDQDVTVKGYVRYKRTQQKVLFIQLYDGSHPVTFQLILDEEKTPLKKQLESSVNVGDCVSATGTIVKSPARGQLIEMQVKELTCLGKVSDPATYLPGVKGVTLEMLRDKQDIRPKFKTLQSIFRIRSKLSELVHRFFHMNKILHLDPNVITTSDCEGSGEVFTITSLFKDGKLS